MYPEYKLKLKNMKTLPRPAGDTWTDDSTLESGAVRLCMVLLFLPSLSLLLPYATAPRVSIQYGAWSDSW